MDDSTRLRIATRIHFALLRHFGAKVEVGELLQDEAAAREALWVCDASGDAELESLARQFREATRALARPRVASAAASRPMPWSRTSGFGVTTRPAAPDLPAPPAPHASWLHPSTWLKGRSTTR